MVSTYDLGSAGADVERFCGEGATASTGHVCWGHVWHVLSVMLSFGVYQHSGVVTQHCTLVANTALPLQASWLPRGSLPCSARSAVSTGDLDITHLSHLPPRHVATVRGWCPREGCLGVNVHCTSLAALAYVPAAVKVVMLHQPWQVAGEGISLATWSLLSLEGQPARVKEA